MSHTAVINIEVKDKQVILSAIARLGYEVEEGEAKLYDGTTARGLVVKIPGWNYPVVINTEEEWEEVLEDGTKVMRKGRIYSDNYGGSWGDQAKLDELLQIYGVEKAKFEAQLKGYNCEESIVLHPETGVEEIQVTINVPDQGMGDGYDGGLNLGGGGLTVD
jgi:hypothetical protein